MSWERFEKDFPHGVETNFGFLTVEDLRTQSDVGVVTVFIRTPAREMTIREETIVYGKDNEQAIVVEYDIENEIEHPDIIHPLNIYGTSMLRDYLQYNYIPLEQLSYY